VAAKVLGSWRRRVGLRKVVNAGGRGGLSCIGLPGAGQYCPADVAHSPHEREEARHDGRASRRVVATMNGVMACIGRVRWSPFFSDYEDTITHRAPEYPDHARRHHSPIYDPVRAARLIARRQRDGR
jgi:hypothetical protein